MSPSGQAESSSWLSCLLPLSSLKHCWAAAGWQLVPGTHVWHVADVNAHDCLLKPLRHCSMLPKGVLHACQAAGAADGGRAQLPQHATAPRERLCVPLPRLASCLPRLSITARTSRLSRPHRAMATSSIGRCLLGTQQYGCRPNTIYRTHGTVCITRFDVRGHVWKCIRANVSYQDIPCGCVVMVRGRDAPVIDGLQHIWKLCPGPPTAPVLSAIPLGRTAAPVPVAAGSHGCFTGTLRPQQPLRAVEVISTTQLSHCIQRDSV